MRFPFRPFRPLHLTASERSSLPAIPSAASDHRQTRVSTSLGITRKRSLPSHLHRKRRKYAPYQIKVKYLTKHLTNAFLCYIFVLSTGSRVVAGPSSENDNRRARQRFRLRTAIPPISVFCEFLPSDSRCLERTPLPSTASEPASVGLRTANVSPVHGETPRMRTLPGKQRPDFRSPPTRKRSIEIVQPLRVVMTPGAAFFRFRRKMRLHDRGAGRFGIFNPFRTRIPTGRFRG